MKPRYLPPTRLPVFTAEIAGESMAPSLHHGDWVLVLRTGRIRVGQVVAARDPRQPDRILVKRAVERSREGWWLLGDNPAESTDSRVFGPVPDRLVLGRVLLRYFPLRLPRLV